MYNYVFVSATLRVRESWLQGIQGVDGLHVANVEVMSYDLDLHCSKLEGVQWYMSLTVDPIQHVLSP